MKSGFRERNDSCCIKALFKKANFWPSDPTNSLVIAEYFQMWKKTETEKMHRLKNHVADLSTLNAAWNGVRFHATGCVHSVTKEGVPAIIIM